MHTVLVWHNFVTQSQKFAKNGGPTFTLNVGVENSDCPFVWCQNIRSALIDFVTKHACDRQTDERTDGQTDRITTSNTALE